MTGQSTFVYGWNEYLVESRLTPLARRCGLDSVSEFIGRMLAGKVSSLHSAVVEAMTTNETSFFRDVHPFETLRTAVLPELLQRNSPERKLQIWCGACSTGQEPYSIAMTLHEHFPQVLTWNLGFLATDLANMDLPLEQVFCGKAVLYRRPARNP